MILTDLLFLYSGGATNADPNASLGGVKSSHVVPSNVLENLFDEVSLAEREVGMIDYRCFYIENAHALDSLLLAALFIQSQTPATSTSIALGVDPAGISAEAQTIVDQTTAPVGVTFLDYPPEGNGLSLGSILAGDYIGIWARRTVAAMSSTPVSDPFTLRLTGVPVTETASPSSP